MRILLIAGGWSNEREVSLSGAKGIHQALNTLGHEVLRLDPAGELDRLMDAARECDFAFINLHGSPGEDGLIQAMLDRVGTPYQGSDPAGSFLALNKGAAKLVFRRAGLDTPDWVFLTENPGPDWAPPFGFPVFVKSNIGGSSLDMRRAENKGELAFALDDLLGKGLDVLVEKGLNGIELTCAVLGQEPLPPILIKPPTGSIYFDYRSKYDVKDGAEEICPAPVEQWITDRLKRDALAAHQALGLKGYSRGDFILEGDRLYLLEVNTLPGMTPTSLLPRSAAAVGYSFEQLIARLIELGLERA